MGISRKRGVRGYEELVREKTQRDTIQEFMENNFSAEKLNELFNELDNAKDKLSLYKDLLPYMIPKYTMIEYGSDTDDKEAGVGIWGIQKERILSRLKKVG